MANALLVVMLTLTQLLGGSGGSVYLCIGNDGNYCCIDAGPVQCKCCHEQVEPAEKKTHCCAKHAHKAKACEPKNEVQSKLVSHGWHSNDSCSCTHILIKAYQPSSALRTVSATHPDQLANVASLISGEVSYDALMVTPSPVFHYGPPSIPAFALTVVSTVVLRI